VTARRRAPRARHWAVYVLRCADGSLYTGATTDVARRLSQHQAGRGARYTRARLPVTLVHSERARDRSGALRREAAIKRLPRSQKLALVGAPDARRGGLRALPSPRPGRSRRD
jgi:putative endonuclease